MDLKFKKNMIIPIVFIIGGTIITRSKEFFLIFGCCFLVGFLVYQKFGIVYLWDFLKKKRSQNETK